jgi:hypothetical protein
MVFVNEYLSKYFVKMHKNLTYRWPGSSYIAVTSLRSGYALKLTNQPINQLINQLIKQTIMNGVRFLYEISLLYLISITNEENVLNFLSCNIIIVC